MAGVEEAIAAAGAALVHLPPYSRDLDPNRAALGQAKASLRKAAAATKGALWQCKLLRSS